MKSRWNVAILAVGVTAVTVLIVSRDLQRARSQQDQQTQRLASGSANLEPIPAPTPIYLEQEPLTGEPKHALLEDAIQPENLLNLVCDQKSSAELKAPPELPPSENLDPVPLLTPERRQANTAIIREVIPDVSDEDLELWLEETRELEPNMIRNMLKIRRQFGGLSEAFGSEQPKRAEQVPEILKSPEFDPTLISIRRARILILQNMLNEKSIGYLAVELRWVDDQPHGVKLASISLSTKPGGNLRTQRSLDIAVRHPHHFLVVQSVDETLLTKFGSLEIGAHRQLQLAIQGAELIVAPGITIPNGIKNVSVKETGEIVGIDAEKNEVSLGYLEIMEVQAPEFLKPVGTACYQLTAKCGRSRKISKNSTEELLIPGTLESSNVNYSDQETTLKMIDRLVKLRQEQQQSAP